MGAEVRFGHTLVEPGEACFVHDYWDPETSDPTEVVIVACALDDQKADITFVPPQGAFDTDDYSGLTQDDLPEDALVETITKDEFFEVDITLEGGAEVVLVVEHTPPNEISEGHIIPTSLVNPN